MEKEWFGIPREEINWFPTINYEKCIGCMTCVKKCTHGVYTEEKGKPKVVAPKNCVVGCTGCESVCPKEAISHQSKEYLQKLAKQKDFRIGCNCGRNNEAIFMAHEHSRKIGSRRDNYG